MAEIEFSLSFRSLDYAGADLIRGLLDQFEAQTGNKVHLDITYPGRADLNRIALYHHGPDVSEIASTWVNDLIAMNSLRPFKQPEINRLGRAEAFVPGAWGTCQQIGKPEIWAVPWVVESMMIHYRQDLLQKAGVAPQVAFQSLANLSEAASALKAAGVPIPVEMPSKWLWFDQLHALSGWLWMNGGAYCTENGKQLLVDQPEAIGAMKAYFGLLRYLSPEGAQLFAQGTGSRFREGHSAILFAPQLHRVRLEGVPEVVRKNWAVARYPGQSFLGGSNLVVWNHTRHEIESLRLVEFLTSAPVELELFRCSRQLPGRLEALNHSDIQQDSTYCEAAKAAVTGRSYLSIPLWGLIEEHLLRVISAIETQVVEDPTVDIEATIHRFIDPVVRRLNLTLSQN